MNRRGPLTASGWCLAFAVALFAPLFDGIPAGAAGPPQVGESWVTAVKSNTATLHAEINPNGISTRYSFEYLTSAQYDANIAAGDQGFAGAASVPTSNNGLGAGSGFQQVSFLLVAPANPLLPGTSYRYRALATNNLSETAVGATRSFTTQQSGAQGGLPDLRAWELVSPIDKGGGQVAAPGSLFGGGHFQAAALGDSFAFSSATAFANPAGAPPASQYIARRSSIGWSTGNVSSPLASGAYGDHPDGAPYRLFSESLGIGLFEGGDPCLGDPTCLAPIPPLPGSGAPLGYRTFYLRTSAGFTSLLSASDIAHTSVSAADFQIALLAATPDLSAIVLGSCAALTADARELLLEPGRCDPSAQNLYLWRSGELRAINVLPGEGETIPGARLLPNALSADGARAYFSIGEDGPLYLFESDVPARLIPHTLGGAGFQAASEDGGVAYFIAGSELYRYDAQVGSSTPVAAGVEAVLAGSEDGSRVYYQSLTGLWSWHLGDRALIAAGPGVATPGDFPPSSATVRLSSDGTRLAFLSARSITEYDNGDAETGEPQTEAYIYDALADHLLCASCNPTGERPQGAATIPGALVNGSTTIYRPRAFSANGSRLFFETTDDLDSNDTNGAADVYQWEAGGEGSCTVPQGCVALISGGRGFASTFLDASADGSDAYFLTADSLLPSDPGSADVYDARINGGLPEPQPPIPCVGDACQPLPSPPQDPTAGTSLPNSGNPAPKYFKEHKKRRDHKHKRHRQHKKRHHRSHR